MATVTIETDISENRATVMPVHDFSATFTAGFHCFISFLLSANTIVNVSVLNHAVRVIACYDDMIERQDSNSV